MAGKRMFALSVIDSDEFNSMPLSTQALYFRINMEADDEGFVDKPKTIMRKIGANDGDMQVLLQKRYLLLFESGVIVIKHWKLHNWIRQDRIKETNYQEEKALLEEKENGVYTEIIPYNKTNVRQVTDNCQHRLDKISLEESSLEESSKDLSDLEKTVNEFKKMRTRIKAPLTDYALKLLNANLDKLAKTDEEKIAILNQSIVHGWKSIYALKSENQNSNKRKEIAKVQYSTLEATREITDEEWEHIQNGGTIDFSN